ncbi:inositol monophosphatase family protein [soil metagenome]
MTTLSRKTALDVAEIAAAAARTEIMPRFNGAAVNDTRQKTSRFDVVTEADEAAEAAIAKALRERFPGALIIGEEAAERDPGLLPRLATADLAFIVDPIDGTKNFSSGVPLFGVMIAATVRGEIALAALHDPICQDTYLAVRGEGAWRQTEESSSALGVAMPLPVDQMHAVAGTTFLPEPLRSIVIRNLPRFAMTFWMRCAAHEYRMAAAGHCDVLMYNKLMPWDHAAGWLLHREAGGYSAHFDGTAYSPSHLSGGLLCAPDRASWEGVREALFEPSDQ